MILWTNWNSSGRYVLLLVLPQRYGGGRVVLRRDTIHHTAAEKKQATSFSSVKHGIAYFNLARMEWVLVGLFSTDEERPNGRIREVLPFVFSADTNEYEHWLLLLLSSGPYFYFVRADERLIIVMLESIGSDKWSQTSSGLWKKLFFFFFPHQIKKVYNTWEKRGDSSFYILLHVT